MKFKNTILYLLAFTLAINFGLFSVNKQYIVVSLEEISQNSEFYDGKMVEIFTFTNLDRVEGKDFVIGEPFEKAESLTFLDLEENSVNLDFLHKQLSENFSINNYKRVKVKITGKVIDNCNVGIKNCCFGKSLRIVVESVKPIGLVENYTVPSKFQIYDEGTIRN